MGKTKAALGKAKRQQQKQQSKRKVCYNDRCELAPNCGLHCQRCGGRCTPLAQYAAGACRCKRAARWNTHAKDWLYTSRSDDWR